MSTAAPAARTAKPRVPKLGVGLAYQEILEPFIAERIDLLDFVEVVPDITWTTSDGRSPRYVDDEAAVAFLRQVRHDVPVIPHSIGLSIGSAHQFDAEHVEQMARWPTSSTSRGTATTSRTTSRSTGTAPASRTATSTSA